MFYGINILILFIPKHNSLLTFTNKDDYYYYYYYYYINSFTEA